MFSIFWPLVSFATLLWASINGHWIALFISSACVGLWLWSMHCAKQRMLAMRLERKQAAESDGSQI
ncbi:hypothetical protein DBZ36_04590 [Alginatibacterium sediminis]|uniref:Uncharacterized protein n=1 Tax=Alginatibacterium sediminis TaxID=2164068 RepID=A0A420EGA4_9ALTE|nr:hypothetical protein [Alginatibacterium sediminis]RKF19741.1 hypothetical protein DBZ36_04590 [Alginatibacterium sediminis]